MKKKIASVMVAAVLAATVAVPSASALQAGSVEPSVSLPYVEDVNPHGSGYVATVTCAGSAKAKLTVTHGKKRVKVRKVEPRVWLVKLKAGKAYKLTVRANGERKSIGYRVY